MTEPRPPSAPAVPSNPARRQLLTGLMGLWGLTVAGFAVPLVRFLTGSAPLAPPADAPTCVLERASLPLGPDWQPLTLRFARRDAWIAAQPTEQKAYVRMQGDQMVLLSAACTHLGCGVDWTPSTQQFICPCHGGRFDPEGAVVVGPPTKPLQALPFTISGDRVTVILPSEGA